MSSRKWRPLWLGLNVLKIYDANLSSNFPRIDNLIFGELANGGYIPPRDPLY